jgi:hypothetical protein
MAKIYWVTLSKIKQDNYFHDYLTNLDKRFQTGLGSNLGEAYWKKYGVAYKSARDNGELLLRAKIINNKNCLKIYQIWENKEARIKFEKAVDPDFFQKSVPVPIITYQYGISLSRKNKIVNLIINSEKVIIQALREDHRLPGIIIGDPLKNDKPFKV